MVISKRRVGHRCGATAVETALVLIPLTMVVFGIFEYGRLLMVWNLINNSAREGCRYALANNTSSTIVSDVQTLVTGYMAGENSCLNNFSVTISTTPGGTALTTAQVNNLVAGNTIAVNVSGQYKFMNIIPYVNLPTTLSLSSSVMMICEGVT